MAKETGFFEGSKDYSIGRKPREIDELAAKILVEQGLRLMRAVLRLQNPALRSAIVKFVEEISDKSP
jgi:hypothetical protein